MALKFLNDGFFDGNVGIGTDNPSQAKLVVNGDIAIPRSNSLVFLESITGTFRAKISSQDSNPYNGLEFYTGGDASTAKMIIEDDGNVGIGTNSPVVRLDFGSTAGAFHLYTSGTDYYGFNVLQYDSGAFSTNIFSGNGGDIKLRTASGGSAQSTRLTVKSDGDVGIGTTSPAKKLHVKESTTATYAAYIENSIAGGDYLAMIGDAGNPVFEFDSGGTGGEAQMKMYSDNVLKNSLNANGSSYFNGGNVGIGTTNPNYPLQISKDSSSTSNGNDSSMKLCLDNPNQTANTYSLINFTDGDAAASGAMGLQYTDHANNYGDLCFITRGTSGYVERMRIDEDGAIKFNAYDSTNNTGTPTYLLGTDASGNVVKALSQNGLGFAPAINFIRSGITSTYTMIATVNGDRYSSIIQMSITGTSGFTVLNSLFDISVNHSQDIHVTSQSGDYTEVTLRITSNNNEDFSIEAKHDGPSAVNAEIWIYPKAGESVTPTTVDPNFSGSEYEHVATEGWRFGGEDNDVESSQVIIDGKLGIGTTSPTAKLDITETTAETNTLKDVLRLSHLTSGTPASGLGAGILFSAERVLNGVNLSRGAIYGISGTSEGNDGDLAFHTRTDTGVDSATAGMNEKMRINNIGDVGIGTSTPTSGGTDAKWLTVNGNAASTYSGGISYTINSVSKAFSYFQSDYLIQQCLSGFGQKFIVNGVNQAMIILSNGNVGIGNTNPVGEIMVGSNWDSVESPNLYIKESTPISSFDPRVVNTSDLGITYATTSTNTTGPDKVGLTLHNNAGVAGQFSPMLIFSSKESGVSPYKTAMAGIYARSPLATGTGGEWNDGELIFATAGINTKGIVQRMVINKEGLVGIGTTAPTEKLEVDGNVQIGSTTDAKLYMVSTGGNGSNERFFIQGYAEGGTYGGGFKLSTRNDSNVFNTAVTVNRNGNVGIGETDPGEKLDVKGGNIRLVDASAGLIFTSPNGKLWKQTISNTGVPVYTDVSP